MTVRQKPLDRSQLNLLLPFNVVRRRDPKQLTTEKVKIEESRKRLMSDLERAGLLNK